MIPMEEIQALADRIAKEFDPERIILFGSYARGDATPDSDVDLLVVLPFEGKSWRMSSSIRRRVRPSFALDLMVRTPEQLAERLRLGDWFMRDIVGEGRALHEA